mgnify:CR=1 FL=1
MKTDNLTEGNVTRSLLFFALPLLGSSLIQQLYSTVDLVFVGQFLGTEASAAVGASSLIITCLVGFFTGMAVGTSVFTAQYFGAKQWKKLHRLVQTMFLVGIGGGLVLMLLGIGGASVFLSAMGTPEDIMPQAALYLRVYMTGMMPVVMYNLLSGVIRALGDSRNPMIFQCVGGVFNIVGDYVCIAVLGMGVEGTAVATVVSQTVAACCAAVYLIRLRAPYALRLSKPGFYTRELGNVLRVGVPAGIQSIVITFSNILIQSQINTLGVTSIAAFTVYFRTEMVLYLPILALGQAVVSFVGQNYGAKKPERIWQADRICILGGSFVIFAAGILLMLAAPVFLQIFTKDTAVIAEAAGIIRITFPLYFLYVILEVLSGNLRGYGKAVAPMLVTIISFCGFRVAFMLIAMTVHPSSRSVAFSYPASWGLAVVLMAIMIRRFMHEKIFH